MICSPIGHGGDSVSARQLWLSRFGLKTATDTVSAAFSVAATADALPPQHLAAYLEDTSLRPEQMN